MDATRSIAKAFLEAWCSRDFDRLAPWVDDEVIDTLRGAPRVVPREVLRADVLAVDGGLQFDFRFRVSSPDGGAGHVVEERVLVHTDGDRVTARELVAS